MAKAGIGSLHCRGQPQQTTQSSRARVLGFDQQQVCDAMLEVQHGKGGDGAACLAGFMQGRAIVDKQLAHDIGQTVWQARRPLACIQQVDAAEQTGGAQHCNEYVYIAASMAHANCPCEWLACLPRSHVSKNAAPMLLQYRTYQCSCISHSPYGDSFACQVLCSIGLPGGDAHQPAARGSSGRSCHTSAAHSPHRLQIHKSAAVRCSVCSYLGSLHGAAAQQAV